MAYTPEVSEGECWVLGGFPRKQLLDKPWKGWDKILLPWEGGLGTATSSRKGLGYTGQDPRPCREKPSPPLPSWGNPEPSPPTQASRG